MIFDVLPAIGIVLAGSLYLRGCLRAGSRVHPARVAASFSGLVVAGLALYGVGELSEATFSGHMIQHVLLMSAAAPLLVAGDAGRVMRRGAPRPVVGAIARLPAGLRAASHSPATCAVAYVIVLWAWHLPVLYETAVRNDLIHAFEHLTFFGASLLLWAVAFGRRRASEPVAILVVFITSLAGAALGAIITFAGTVLYPVHAVRAPAIGLDPLVDQQLAGAIMWIPPGVVSLGVMVLLTARLLGRASRPSAVGSDR